MDLNQYIGSMNAKDCIYQNPEVGLRGECDFTNVVGGKVGEGEARAVLRAVTLRGETNFANIVQLLG